MERRSVETPVRSCGNFDDSIDTIVSTRHKEKRSGGRELARRASRAVTQTDLMTLYVTIFWEKTKKNHLIFYFSRLSNHDILSR